MVQVGKPAPAFTLPDQDGKAVSLDGLRGHWVVLYFYPKDDTPGCTVEACEFTAALPDFRGLGAVIFGCSADGASAHTKFIAKHKLGIQLLTDADRKVMNAYGAFGEKMMYGKKVEGVIRSTVLIAPDGTVAHHWKTVKAAGHAEQVKLKLLELASSGAAAAVPQAAKKVMKVAKKPAKQAGKKIAKKAPVKKAPAKAAKAKKKAKK